eukprot:12938435-Prorocentrum_lima.AAC.1
MSIRAIHANSCRFVTVRRRGGSDFTRVAPPCGHQFLVLHGACDARKMRAAAAANNGRNRII